VKLPKATDEDKKRFQRLVPNDPAVEVKPMFGNLGAFVNGNMFMGLFGSSIGLKLPEDDRARLLAEPGAGPFGPEERPMRGYVALPQDWSPRKALPWTARALSHVAALPAKRKAGKP
jgi:TfoX/Sxy family transcriptional regulator of competence genes